MTLEQAAELPGAAVVYTPTGEQGRIVRTGPAVVFVRYGTNPTPQATDPADLVLLSEIAQ